MDLVAELVRTGVVNSSGRFCDPAATHLSAPLANRLAREGGKAAFRVSERVALTQGDVRQVQLAKGAIRAGIDLLLAARDITASAIDRVFIAGSFGFHLREESLLTLGLLPPEVAGKVSFLGNTAKSGGALLLLNRDLRDQLASLVPHVAVVELAADPLFDRAFMAAMKF
ncbi:MAG TPA: ASKHA domain-containing protein, partial [Geobacteraceae bacterium]